MDEIKRPLYILRILISFVIATVLFLSGFFVSNLISQEKYDDISFSQEELRYQLFSLELQREILSSSCDNFDYSRFSQELGEMGGYLTILEERLGKKDKRVLEQKKVYSMLEVQHFLFIKDYNENCDDDFTTILFFYSNEALYLDKATRLGFILEALKSQEDNVMIYSFDYDLDSDLINALKLKYEIENQNTLILNEEIKIEDLKNINEIKQYL